ncbi:hypothetical protein [uncultured Fusobacterium sp.]|uniref:hypothetical protein n=1 Tax=uncultured Fusobacterium sp. TaxID=159267 RepID=UPI0025FABC96|nr:hypothetical protein [uncultured Fusobacterium sp.]
MKSKRLKYNPEIHFNHQKEWTTKDLIYLCGVYEIDKKRDLSISFGRTEGAIFKKANVLKKEGLFEKYKKLYNFEN